MAAPGLHLPFERRVRPQLSSWTADCGIYLLWGLCGALYLTTLAGAFTIGIFVLPFALITSALATYSTFGRRYRPQCVAGMLLPVGLGIGWLGSWLTYSSSDPGDQCHRSNGVTACVSSEDTDASGHTIDTTVHRPGALPTGFQWSHTWPYVATGVTVMLLSAGVFVLAGVAVRRSASRAR